MNMIRHIAQSLDLSEVKTPNMVSPLVLAYIGDTVFDLYVRTMLVSSGDAPAHALHKMSAGHVCAKAQAAAYHRIADMLTEPESAVFRRGRNAHSATVPKNASITDYRAATGLEALIGFLYLSGEDDRIAQLMRHILIPATEAEKKYLGKEREDFDPCS